MSQEQFFPWLKQESEKYWSSIGLKDFIYGFQVQAGTRWNEGLTEEEIARFEGDIGFEFPSIYKRFLKTMNGTDKDTINIYGCSGEPTRYAAGYYAYPKDLDMIRKKIAWICESCHVTPDDIEAGHIPHILPIVGHRFLVIDRCTSNPVLSMYGDDIIPYASNLMTFLVNDIFRNAAPDPDLPSDVQVTFWLK
jgi:hypothetical protein